MYNEAAEKLTSAPPKEPGVKAALHAAISYLLDAHEVTSHIDRELFRPRVSSESNCGSGKNKDEPPIEEQARRLSTLAAIGPKCTSA